RAHHRPRAGRARPHRGGCRVRDPAGTGAHHPSPVANESLKTMGFPHQRPRRTRQSDAWRRMVRETHLTPDAFIYPLFVVPGRGAIDNDSSIQTLAEVALNYARAGADAVAPSDMMDGRVAAIRARLDEAGHATTPIVAYAAKFASSFYGPFREAAESAPAFGDRRSYQMDPANAREALREALLDVEEGADLVM